ncbi:MAG: hypothetical protein U1F76_22650 [Candidatus Competibacteraceae bacterium]
MPAGWRKSEGFGHERGTITGATQKRGDPLLWPIAVRSFWKTGATSANCCNLG